MNNQIIIDLQNIDNAEDVLMELGNIFEFGGPNGNTKIIPGINKGWGFNYSALNDSLTCLEDGGIWGTSKKFTFPLSVHFTNTHSFKVNDMDAYQSLVEIFERNSEEYKAEGKEFIVEFE